MALERRPHQTRAVADVLSGFRKHDRGQLIMACGTGKTAVALWVKEDMDAMRTLVLVPSLALVDQFASEWRKHYAPDQEYAALCVCSDSTVGQPADDDYDAVNFTAGELAQDGFDVTSDPERIAAFLREGGRRVIFSTYQSSHLLAAAQNDESVPAFDLAIADEAHRCTGDGNNVFATILDGDRIRAARRLFATATPRIYRTRKGNEESAAIVVDMSDETRFGPRFHTLTFGEAIRRDLLSDYRVAIVMVDDSEVHSALQNGDDKSRILQAAQVGLLKAVHEYDLRRVISFHSRIESAKIFAENLPAVAGVMGTAGHLESRINADSVSGKMSSEIRKEKMAAFRATNDGQCNVLTNARCLSEGVDVPDIDGIAFIDPRSNHVDIIQALGRAIRKHETKPYGVVILPVFAGKGNNPVQVIENSNFKPVWDVLDALRAHDADFDTALKMWRQRQGDDAELGETDPFDKLRIIGTHHVPEFVDAFRPHMIDKFRNHQDAEAHFVRGLTCLDAYKAAKGTVNVPFLTRWPEIDLSGFPLGRWMDSQRQRCKRGELSPEQITELDARGFEWEPRSMYFRRGLECIAAYIEANGHCRNPPERWPDQSNGFLLRAWTRNVRQYRKRGELSPKQIAELDARGFEWEPRKQDKETHFFNGLMCLDAYIEANGHCRNPPERWPDQSNGFPLKNWIASIRRDRKRGKLSLEWIAELDARGFEWEPLHLRFAEGLRCSAARRAKYGDCNAPKESKWPEDDPLGFSLGQWQNVQRVAKRKGLLSPERLAELDALGFKWELRIAGRRSLSFAIEDVVERLENEDINSDLSDQMAYFGCDLVQSRALIETGAYDEALELLEEATGESLRTRAQP